MRSSIRPFVSTAIRVIRGLALVLAAAVGLTAGLAPTAAAEAFGSKWRAAIDATWGPGLAAERKLETFDAFWTTVDQRVAAFQAVDVDWAAPVDEGARAARSPPRRSARPARIGARREALVPGLRRPAGRTHYEPPGTGAATVT